MIKSDKVKLRKQLLKDVEVFKKELKDYRMKGQIDDMFFCEQIEQLELLENKLKNRR